MWCLLESSWVSQERPPVQASLGLDAPDLDDVDGEELGGGDGAEGLGSDGEAVAGEREVA